MDEAFWQNKIEMYWSKSKNREYHKKSSYESGQERAKPYSIVILLVWIWTMKWPV